MVDQPIAYFITWTTYGSWLPGCAKGWVKRKTWGIQAPDAVREEQARLDMVEDEVTLTHEQREIVDRLIVEHCEKRKWILHARNVRTNHVHVLVTANLAPERVREDLKAWASRRLSDHAQLPCAGRNGRRKWWTEKGDIELIWDEEGLLEVMDYILNRQ